MAKAATTELSTPPEKATTAPPSPARAARTAVALAASTSGAVGSPGRPRGTVEMVIG